MLVALFQRDELLLESYPADGIVVSSDHAFRKVRDGGTPSPALETSALPSDPRAVAHARRNARLNRISHATSIVADVLRLKIRRQYDVITANLFGELLIVALPIFRRALRRNDRMILSGILREQASTVRRALNRAGVAIERDRRRGKLVALQVVASRRKA